MTQRRADALVSLLERGTDFLTEVVVHVRSDGNSFDDGTPLSDHSVLAKILGQSDPHTYVRALIHDAEGHPINASSRQRHPTTRQKRVVQARDGECVDCGSVDQPEYDHVPAYEYSRRTLVDELQLRCAPCHRARHGKYLPSGA